jgi:hypothetical protein
MPPTRLIYYPPHDYYEICKLYMHIMLNTFNVPVVDTYHNLMLENYAPIFRALWYSPEKQRKKYIALINDSR